MDDKIKRFEIRSVDGSTVDVFATEAKWIDQVLTFSVGARVSGVFFNPIWFKDTTATLEKDLGSSSQ